jgi:hypothetical protein
MHPVLRDGDYAILRRVHPPAGIDVGDIVLVNHPRFGLIIKTLRARIGADTVLLEGKSPTSATIDDLGPISICRVLAILVWRIARPLRI